MLTKLSTKMRDEYMPHIKALFAKADTDKSGDLDRMEFEVFYPDLREYLGYPLPPITQCTLELLAPPSPPTPLFQHI
jgi:hypothetical protein